MITILQLIKNSNNDCTFSKLIQEGKYIERTTEITSKVQSKVQSKVCRYRNFVFCILVSS